MYRHAGAPKDARRDSQHFAAINTVPFTCNFNVVAKLGGAVLRCQQCVRRSRGWIQRQRTDVRADPGSVERRRQIHCGRVGQGRQDACMHACMAGHVHAAAVLLDRVRALRARLRVGQDPGGIVALGHRLLIPPLHHAAADGLVLVVGALLGRAGARPPTHATAERPSPRARGFGAGTNVRE